MNKDLLRSMLTNYINDNHSQTDLDIKAYLNAKMQEVAGLGKQAAVEESSDPDKKLAKLQAKLDAAEEEGDEEKVEELKAKIKACSMKEAVSVEATDAKLTKLQGELKSAKKSGDEDKIDSIKAEIKKCLLAAC